MSEADSAPRVAVVIVAWNRADELASCLDSFACVDYPNYEVVVVDNASEDATVATVRARHPSVTLVVNERNVGYGGGGNAGFRYALAHGAEYMLLLNQDTKMTASLLPELVRVMQSDPRIGIAGAKNLLMENPAYTWGRYGALTWGPLLVRTVGRYELDHTEVSPRDVDWVIGNACMFSRAALEQVGLFDEEFFHLNEDVDWSTRARKQGFRVVYADTATILHQGSSSVDARKPVGLGYAYFLGRNAILFARKHATRAQWAKLLTLMALAQVLRVGWLTITAAYIAEQTERPFLIGVVDGFTGRLRRERVTSHPPAPATVGPTIWKDNALHRFLRRIGA